MQRPLPHIQRAVQLVGRDELLLNGSAVVPRPGPHQVVCQVEAVGLCFSDLKLIKQFSDHPRKSEVIAGIDPAALAEIPSYVPGARPTVPGHETVVRVAAVGSGITRWKPGERYLVQTDYRWLPTRGANSAFGYNFEGALQEYVLMDERVIVAPDGESMLLPVPDTLSASSVALVEPWACVEDAYADRQRQGVKAGGRLLAVADIPQPRDALDHLVHESAAPTSIAWAKAENLESLPEAHFDDVVYFGARAETVERLFAKLAPHGLLNLVLCGRRFARPVATPVGRAHYHALRVIGTTGDEPADSLAYLPATSELRDGDRVNVIGAGGPMGVMHVLRALALGRRDLSVYAADLDDARLEHLRVLASKAAAKSGTCFHTYNPAREAVTEGFSYLAVMAPVPRLVAQAVDTATPGAIINIFAGIPTAVTAELDLNAYVEKHLYLVGTSGSTVDDMRAVLSRLQAGLLDTDLSVAAVAGLEGAIEGIRAVEANRLPGKIVIYPSCRGLGLTPLPELAAALPKRAPLPYGLRWNGELERALLEAKG